MPRPSSMRNWRRPGWGYVELLASLVALIVLQSVLTGATRVQTLLFDLLFLGVTLAAIRTLSDSRWRRRLGLGFGVVAFAASCLAVYWTSLPLVGFVYFNYTGLSVILLISLAEGVFGGGGVDWNRIVGAVTIFVLLGLLWALIYMQLELYVADSFSLTAEASRGGVHQEVFGELLYFSNVTLTTLGFGDVVPVSPLARILATLEAMCGQLFLTIVIARLVGQHLSQATA